MSQLASCRNLDTRLSIAQVADDMMSCGKFDEAIELCEKSLRTKGGNQQVQMAEFLTAMATRLPAEWQAKVRTGIPTPLAYRGYSLPQESPP